MREEITIKTEFIKLDQFLKYIGIVQTGGQASFLIEDGLVQVNGEEAYQRGLKLKKGDLIEVQDEHKYVVV